MAARRGSILWVDDEIDLLKSQIMFLEDRGYKVTPVSNGEDAVGMVKEETFDLVLLDQMMPGLDGYQVLENIRNRRATRNLPVVMLSAVAEPEAITRCFELGADDYITKPFEAKELQIRVKNLIDQRRKLRGEL